MRAKTFYTLGRRIPSRGDTEAPRRARAVVGLGAPFIWDLTDTYDTGRVEGGKPTISTTPCLRRETTAG